MAKTSSVGKNKKKEKMAMVIIPVKSPKSGAYVFKKSIMSKEKVLEFFDKT